MKYTLGIDLHKKTSAWVVIDDERNEILKSSVACHPVDISMAIGKMPVSPKEVQVAIEPVAGWRWVTTQFKEAGMEVHTAHPRKIRLIAASNQKNDKNDALMLAELLRSGYFPESRRVSDEVFEMRTMLRDRAYVVSLRTGVKNRIHGIATTQGLHLVDGGNPLHKKGKSSIMKGNNEALKELHLLIEDFDTRIVPFDCYVTNSVKNSKQAKLLMTMPLVGPITALTVASEVGDFLQFLSPEKLTSFAGLVPKERSSGGQTRFGSITNAGSRYLRTAMVEAAMRINETNAPELLAFVERLKPSCGAKRARVALARKMLAIMWTMIKKETAYDPKLVRFASVICNTRMSDLDISSDA